MASAALRGVLSFALACAWVGLVRAGEAPARAAPGRPASVPAVPVRKFNGVEYVALVQAAGSLGLKAQPRPGGRTVGLSGMRGRTEFEADSRDVTVNGLRVFLGSPVIAVGGELFISRIDFERCFVPLVRPGYGVALAPAPKIIVVDAGHGGPDIGAPNPRVGIVEKSMTLDVALRVRKLLQAQGYKVVMTRTDDRLPAPKSEDLSRRAEIANQAHADLFVSIHFNVVERDPQRTRGVEVYTFPPAGQHATDWWSAMSRDDAHFEKDPQPGNAYDHWNVVLAQALHRQLVVSLRSDDRGKKLMHLGVLRGLNCPGVLIEPAVISNDAEARKLTVPDYRQKIAQAVCDGIRDYVTTLDRVRQAASSTSSSANGHTTRQHKARSS